MNTLELLKDNNWFIQHPEKVAGVEYETSGFIFPIMVKGSREDVERVMDLKPLSIDDVLNDPIIVEAEKQRKKDLEEAGWTENDVEEMASFVNKKTKEIELAKAKATAIKIKLKLAKAKLK